MKKQVIISSEIPSYKANLHCHSTISDGSLTVQQIKEAYMNEGYSIVAFTDHDVFVPHNDLCEEGRFLALNGYEVELSGTELNPFGCEKCAHICFIAKTDSQRMQVGYNKDKYIWGNALKVKPLLTYDRDDYERVYSHEGVNDIMKRAHEAGFFVTYNHPDWSMEDFRDYSGYEGMDAMEIFNTGCDREGFVEYNSRVYDDLLRQGKYLYVVAADDNHNRRPLSDPLSDSFGGFVYIKAEELTYPAIIRALETGNFYASQGPEIKEMFIENDEVVVRTSPVHKINYITGIRRCQSAAVHYGESLTEARFKISADEGYFRIDVIDDHGKHANTSAVLIAGLY